MKEANSGGDLVTVGLAIGLLLLLALCGALGFFVFKWIQSRKCRAGLKPGLEVWRIEKMKMVPVPEEQFGHFFAGDSYIVLHTKSAGDSMCYNLHFWLGDQSSQDERGAAAILATQLGESLEGCQVQHREVQEKESPTFTGYFKQGITYMQGGVDSGFKHTVVNASDVKRLIHVKGRRTVRAREVDMAWKSFNKGDIFIVENGNDIFQWNGSKSNRYERLKACELVNGIKNEEKAGKGTITVINEGDTIPPAMLEVLEGKPEDVAPEIVDEFINFSRPAQLFKISSDGDKLITEPVATAPFQQSALTSTDCFVVDNGANGSLFVWKGREAGWDERSGAMANALKFVSQNNYPPSTNIQVMSENSETVLFTQFFKDWKRKDQSVGMGQIYTFEKIAATDAKLEESAFPYQIKFDVSSLYEKPSFAAEQKMVDDGSGEVQVWRVDGTEMISLPREDHGRFFSGDCYIILYTYTPQTRVEYIVYYWQGLDAIKEEIAQCAVLIARLDDKCEKRAVKVRVVQGKEPKHMLSIFGRPIMISSGAYPRKKWKKTPPPSKVLYQVRSTSAGGTKVIQVDVSAKLLNSNDAFLLKNDKNCFIWVGSGANELEIAAAEYGADRLGMKSDAITTIKEGEETDDFWEVLGGKEEYASSPRFKEDLEDNAPRMFAISDAKGQLLVEEVPGEFTQSDLEPDDIMMLDAWDEIFVWIGEGANEQERKEAPKLVQEYIDKDPRGRDPNCPIIEVQMDSEPVTFTGFFPSWDSDYKEKRKAYVEMMSNLGSAEAAPETTDETPN